MEVLDGKVVTIDDAEVQALRAGMRGQVLRADDAGYDAARHVWNGMIDRRPALIARCTSAEPLAPAREATSTSRIEFDEFGAPITSTMSALGAIAFTASCRFVVA